MYAACILRLYLTLLVVMILLDYVCFFSAGVYIMSAVANTFENVKAVILSAHKNTTSTDKVSFYNSWAENYDQVR